MPETTPQSLATPPERRAGPQLAPRAAVRPDDGLSRASRRDAPGPVWRVGGRILRPEPFLVAGIVNVTPDSFFDGGTHDAFEAALDHGLKLFLLLKNATMVAYG